MSRSRSVALVTSPRPPDLPSDAEQLAALDRQQGEQVPIYLPYGECLTGLERIGAPRRLLFDGDRIIGVLVG